MDIATAALWAWVNLTNAGAQTIPDFGGHDRCAEAHAEMSRLPTHPNNLPDCTATDPNPEVGVVLPPEVRGNEAPIELGE